MLGVSGLAIGVFKTGALALIGDISTSTAQHTSIMNTVEGFFGVGAIIGPAILTRMLAAGMSWTWLYVLAGTICVVLIVLALLVKYPRSVTPARPRLVNRNRARDEERIRARVLCGRVSLRRRGSRDLCLDADTDGRLHRFCGDTGHLQHLDLLSVARGRALSRAPWCSRVFSGRPSLPYSADASCSASRSASRAA